MNKRKKKRREEGGRDFMYRNDNAIMQRTTAMSVDPRFPVTKLEEFEDQPEKAQHIFRA